MTVTYSSSREMIQLKCKCWNHCINYSLVSVIVTDKDWTQNIPLLVRELLAVSLSLSTRHATY